MLIIKPKQGSTLTSGNVLTPVAKVKDSASGGSSDPSNDKGSIYNTTRDEDSNNKKEKKKKEKKEKKNHVASDTKTPNHKESKDVQQDQGDPIPFDLFSFFDISFDGDSAEEKKKKNKEREAKEKLERKKSIKVKKTEHSERQTVE